MQCTAVSHRGHAAFAPVAAPRAALASPAFARRVTPTRIPARRVARQLVRSVAAPAPGKIENKNAELAIDGEFRAAAERGLSQTQSLCDEWDPSDRVVRAAFDRRPGG